MGEHPRLLKCGHVTLVATSKNGSHNAMDVVSAILKDDDTPNLTKATQREFVPFRESFTSSNATTHCTGSAHRIFHSVMAYNIHERANGTQQQYHQQDWYISSLQSVEPQGSEY